MGLRNTKVQQRGYNAALRQRKAEQGLRRICVDLPALLVLEIDRQSKARNPPWSAAIQEAAEAWINQPTKETR